MKERGPDPREVERIVDLALREDVGSGDITSGSVFGEDEVLSAAVRVKERGVICGLGVAGAVFRKMDGECEWEEMTRDGLATAPGDVVARVTGNARGVLSAERSALNILQRMSGISTLTSLFVEAVRGTGARIMDTRKTVPGFRALAKYAVAAGGGRNHRKGLYDGVLIKDNHVKAAGGVAVAVGKAREKTAGMFDIEVETGTMDEVREAVSAGADVIMLDNMSVEEMTEAVRFVDGRALVEASGGVNLATAREIALAGVDFISVGMLTHSAPSLDISFDVLD